MVANEQSGVRGRVALTVKDLEVSELNTGTRWVESLTLAARTTHTRVVLRARLRVCQIGKVDLKKLPGELLLHA